MSARALTEADYRALARWRYALRRFLRFSETAARRAGISPSQYQLLLFVRSFRDRAPTVADLAERLQVRHQSAVGLIDRSERAKLVRRERDPSDRRRVLVALTPRGSRVIEQLVLDHFRTLTSLGRSFVPPALRAPNGRRTMPSPAVSFGGSAPSGTKTRKTRLR